MKWLSIISIIVGCSVTGHGAEAGEYNPVLSIGDQRRRGGSCRASTIAIMRSTT